MTQLFLSILYASVLFHLNPSTGGIDESKIAGDSLSMNWIVSPNGEQYAWIEPEYTWGLGRLKADGQEVQWKKADCFQAEKKCWTSIYKLTDELTLTVTRKYKGKFLMGSYAFHNRSKRPLSLKDIEINTPFNDNYPNTETCLGQRCHAHIWAGDEAERYVARVGEKIRVRAGRQTTVFTVEKAGDNRFDFLMNGKRTYIEVFGLGCEPDTLMRRRADFILS